jgi:hypothetical protein
MPIYIKTLPLMITTQPCKLLRAHKQMQKKETNASVTLNRIPKSSVYIYRVLKFFFFPFDHCFKPGQGGGGPWGTGLILGGLQEVAGMHPN